MKIYILAILAVGMFLFQGCGEQGYRGKIDNSPYATRSCNQSLSRGSELDARLKVDKIVVYKKKRKLFTYRKGKKIDTFRISLGKNGNKGHKIQMGDYRTPEGNYRTVRKKCDNRLYKSIMISYPDRTDILRARKRGVKPGNYITIHGQPKWNADGRGDNYTFAHDWTEGCIAVSNKAMDRLWRGVKNGTAITIYP